MATTEDNNNINPRGLDNKCAPPEEDDEMTSAAISDDLTLEMRSGPNANGYFEQADIYASRASGVDGKNAKRKPEFHLDSKHFSHELRF